MFLALTCAAIRPDIPRAGKTDHRRSPVKSIVMQLTVETGMRRALLFSAGLMIGLLLA